MANVRDLKIALMGLRLGQERYLYREHVHDFIEITLFIAI